ncbi:hypothetical protein EB235_25100 [Mesorhizobium loti R88b]|uniref:Uncharacterized protein n=1 Tax=Mesorhizobium loti R88b TaxID=935548 RepID=A0A6M7WQK3_RHILI|nr:hypothetical protein EB235_25100 [Mesorhizobium loti R88b]
MLMYAVRGTPDTPMPLDAAITERRQTCIQTLRFAGARVYRDTKWWRFKINWLGNLDSNQD